MSDSPAAAAGSWKSAATKVSDLSKGHSPSVDEQQVDAELCVECFEWASLRCEDCKDEFYCGAEHRDRHYERHKVVCSKSLIRCNVSAPSGDCDSKAVVPTVDEQEAPLLRLPWELQVLLCRELGALDLVRLGWVCRALRTLARHPDAWAHVELHAAEELGDWQDDDGIPRSHAYLLRRRAAERRGVLGALRVAPALHTLRVAKPWPPVNLLRCTARVRVFELRWTPFGEPCDGAKLRRVLEHYRGHLKVVKLNRLHDVELLDFLDGLGLEELHVGRVLARAYPPSGKVVTELEAGEFVGGEVLARLLRSCRQDLVAFEVPTNYLIELSDWAYNRDSPAWRELELCSSLDIIIVQTPKWPSIFDAFPKLRALILWDAAEAGHDTLRHFFASSRAVRRLEVLGLQLSFMGHRGIIQVAAEACHALKRMLLYFDSESTETIVMAGTGQPDVPRDLAAILGRLGDLEELDLHDGRVPSTVFDALAEGALPNLKELQLQRCTVTPKGRDALQTLKSSRPGLVVVEFFLKSAEAREPLLALDFGDEDEEVDEDRCSDSMCAEPSDCEEYDPIPDEGDDDYDDGDGDGMSP